MSQIEKLSKEQEVLLPLALDKWLQIGLSTTRSTDDQMRSAMSLAYAKANLPEPMCIILESPLQTSIVSGMLKTRARVRDQVRDQIRAQVWAQVWDQVRAQVGAQVWAQAWDQVGAQVWAQVGDQVGDQVRAQVRDQDVIYCYGQHDASWLAFYWYFKEIGLDVSLLDGLFECAEHCGWFLPYSNVSFVSAKPCNVYFDERNVLHNDSGPAVSYLDGFSVYCWHGVRVERYVIEKPDIITVDDIEEEPNAEVRRVKIERYGTYNYIVDSGAVQLDHVPHDDIVHGLSGAKLWRKEVAGDEPIVMLSMINSTPEPDGSRKEYFIRVPPNMQTVRQAMAWSWDLSVDEYNPQTET